jgi:hypothetical protein
VFEGGIADFLNAAGRLPEIHPSLTQPFAVASDAPMVGAARRSSRWRFSIADICELSSNSTSVRDAG